MLWMVIACAPVEEPDRVEVAGVAFRFGSHGERMPDVEVVSAGGSERTDNEGVYALSMDAGDSLVVEASADGFVTMSTAVWLFEDSVQDLNLQMIPDAALWFYEIALGVTPDPQHCQIATTVHVADIVGLTLEEFVSYGHHGIEGATVTASPELPSPVYVSETYAPDPELAATTLDGGVVFVNVEPGTYTLTAHHPSVSFDELTVTCEAGGFVNAGPPYGLRERP
jgi:hypothetical protein